MNDAMAFPDTVEEFMEQYKVVDVDHVYSNGIEFVPIYRMKQWFEHQPEKAVKDCRNCKYGNYNDHWDTHFCYNLNECVEWNLWESKAQPERKVKSHEDPDRHE